MSGIERLRAIRAKYATNTTQSNDADVSRGRTRKRATDKVGIEAPPAIATTKALTAYVTHKHTPRKPLADKAEVFPTTRESMIYETLRKHKQRHEEETLRKQEHRFDEESNDTRTFQDLVHEDGDDGE
jgi:transposase